MYSLLVVCLFSHSSVVNHLDEQQANLDSVQETLSSLFNLDQEAFTDVCLVMSCVVSLSMQVGVVTCQRYIGLCSLCLDWTFPFPLTLALAL